MHKIKLTQTQDYTLCAHIRQHQVVMDTAPVLGSDLGPSPKELMLSSIAGCSAMDVIGLLKKNKVVCEEFYIESQAQAVETYPKVYKEIYLYFNFKGLNLPEDIIRDAVYQSMTKYCGVSAMIFKTSPIFYKILINGREVEANKADFKI